MSREPTRGTSRRTLIMTIRSAGLTTLVQYAATLLLAPIVFDGASVATFGAWATIASILAVGALADAGLRLEISRRVAHAAGEGDEEAIRRSVHEGTTLLTVVALVTAVGGGLASPLIRAFAFPEGMPGLSNPEADLLLRATFLLLACSLLADGYFAVLRGLQRADVETNSRLVGVVVGTITAIVGIELGWSLWALFAGAAAQDITAIALQAVGTRRVVPELRFRMAPIRGTAWRGLIALSGMALLSQISDVVDSQWDKVLLSRYVGSTAVAGFQVGTSLALQAKALAILPAAPLLVAIAELRHRDPERSHHVLTVLSASTFAIGAVALSGLVVFAPPFLRLWLGQELPSAVTSARLFAVAVGLNLLAAPLAYRALGEMRHRLTAIASLANIGVNAVAELRADGHDRPARSAVRIDRRQRDRHRTLLPADAARARSRMALAVLASAVAGGRRRRCRCCPRVGRDRVLAVVGARRNRVHGRRRDGGVPLRTGAGTRADPA